MYVYVCVCVYVYVCRWMYVWSRQGLQLSASMHVVDVCQVEKLATEYICICGYVCRYVNVCIQYMYVIVY